MNENLSEPLVWDEDRRFDRGKVLTREDLDEVGDFGRYLDVDGDGIGYRTLPGTHPTKGAFFTRGTSRDAYARYTEAPEPYTANMDRLLVKWRTAQTLMPAPEISGHRHRAGIVYYGTTAVPMPEALHYLARDGVRLDTMRIRGFPFPEAVADFIDAHDFVFVAEQNRDGQMKTLLVNEAGAAPAKLVSVLSYGGLSISADTIRERVLKHYDENNLVRLTEVSGA